MHRPGAEIQPAGPLLCLRYAHDCRQQIFNSLVFAGRDGNAGNPKFPGKLIDIDAAAIGAHFIHHVKSQNHGDIQLKKLQSEVEVALDICGIDDVDDGIGMPP